MVYTCFNETDQSFLTNNLHNYTSLKLKRRIDGCIQYFQCVEWDTTCGASIKDVDITNYWAVKAISKLFRNFDYMIFDIPVDFQCL